MSAKPRGFSARSAAATEEAVARTKRTFPPVVDERARVLVLGTLPGEQELRVQQYYAHSRNLFWPILFAMFDAVPVPDYDAKLAFALAQSVALWDVCMVGERRPAPMLRSREIPGCSAPTRRSVRSLSMALARAASTIAISMRRPDLTYLAMPSTSPARARLDFAAKLAKWTALREILATTGA